MKPVTYITFLVDSSLSMMRFAAKIPAVYWELVENIKANADGQEIYLRVLQFAGTVPSGSEPFVPLEEFTTSISYSPDGASTRLYQAIINALIHRVGKSSTTSVRMLLDKPDVSKNAASLLVVLTDGEANDFRLTTTEQVRQAIKDHGDTLTVAMNVPKYSEKRLRELAETYGIPRENITTWEMTDEGLTSTTRTMAAATMNYMKSTRAEGKTKSSNFYDLTTDLSGLSSVDVSQHLANLNGKFMSRRVNKEERIDEFVQRETGQPYLRGMAFYQLTKPELVQGNKDVLLREKGKVTVWGGPHARNIIGLQPFKDGKVVPGNHAKWDIFIQSHADNRKLVRGTDLLIRK